MSLRDAVTEIVEKMEEYATENSGTMELSAFAYQLRLALKASGDGSRLVPYQQSEAGWERERRLIKEQEAKKAQRDAEDAKVLLQRDQHGTCFAELEENGVVTLCPIDPKMPVGAYTEIGGVVYQLAEGRKLVKKVQNDKSSNPTGVVPSSSGAS